jgi:SAM-dependent methyltransferase
VTKQGEIDYFKNISTEGVKHSLNKPYSDIFCGRYLMELGAIMLLLPTPPAKLLDLGCGTGWTSLSFARRGYDVTGQDISETAIQYANKIMDHEKIDHLRFIVGDYEDMNFDNEFDCAVFFDSLHHADNEEDAIRMVYRALKPGGICITSEPGIGHGTSKTSREVARLYGVTEKDMPPKRIIRAGGKAGFKIFEIYPHTSSNAIVYGRTGNKGILTKLLHLNPIRIFAAISVIIFYRKFSGIVLMIK